MANLLRQFLSPFWSEWLRYLRIVELKKKNPTVSIAGSVQFLGPLDNLVLGANVVIQAGTVIHLGGMEWCEWKGYLAIGDNSVISPHCVIYAAGPGGIRIGKNFDCGPGVGIFASRRNYLKPMNNHVFGLVEIGDDVTVFANVVISPGVKIGDNSVIAAGSVIIKDIPPNVLAGGVPARIIKEIHVRNH